MRNDSRFNEIKTLYNELSSAEKEVLNTQLSAAEDSGYKAFKAMARFMKAFIEHPYEPMKSLLGSEGMAEGPEHEVNAMLHLSKEFLLEQLSLFINVERAGVYSNQFRTRISCIKKLEQARILMSRNLLEQSNSILMEVMSKANKYELHNIGSEAIRLLQLHASIEKNARKLKKLEIPLKDTATRAQLRSLAESIYLELNLCRNSSGQVSELELLSKKCEELQRLNKTVGLAYVEYVCQLVKLELLASGAQYTKAENACKKLIELINTSPALGSNERLIQDSLTLS
jgi:hypothetical protein